MGCGGGIRLHKGICNKLDITEGGEPGLGNPGVGSAKPLITDRSLSCFKLKPAARYDEGQGNLLSYTHQLPPTLHCPRRPTCETHTDVDRNKIDGNKRQLLFARRCTTILQGTARVQVLQHFVTSRPAHT